MPDVCMLLKRQFGDLLDCLPREGMLSPAAYLGDENGGRVSRSSPFRQKSAFKLGECELTMMIFSLSPLLSTFLLYSC